MKTLRIFIDHNLDQEINWTLLDNNQTIDEGISKFEEIQNFTDVQIEVYLNASCCSIFKANTSGISSKKLTDELTLGLLEDNLADDIEELKPLVMQVEDNLTYIAIFNRAFYDQLLLELVNLNKPIKFVQSFVYSTAIDEDNNSWTLYLSKEQSFIRISQFEYYLLDDTRPIPTLLEDMLETYPKPTSILVYADQEYDLSNIQTKYGINYEYASNPLDFGIPIWNFYNQKSSSFKIKIDDTTKANLINLSQTFKYFLIIMVSFWFINIINLYINKFKLERELKNNLSKISKIDNINPGTLNTLNDKLTDMIHRRGLRAEEDFIPMFKTFLKVVSSVGTDDITQVIYDNNYSTLNIFVRNFDTRQFEGYRDILKTQRIFADITDYKSYVKTAKNNQDNKIENIDSKDTQPISNDTQWVITLKSAWIYESLRK